MADLVGLVLGPYQITAKLGRGGMADVYKAWHRELELNRAIKVIRPEFVGSDDFRARFQKEAQGVARLRHQNIVQVHDFGIDDGHYYMVMEFLEGSTLKAVLVRDGKLSIDKALKIIRAVADALTVAHAQDLIHRDIKPDNIMLTTDERVVLMDFGIAKLVTASTAITQTGTGIGTPAYMAPEQAKGLTISAATDVYALGIVLFEMLTGRVPYDADTPIAVMLKAISDPMPMPRSLNPNISESLQGVILKATAKDPLARYVDVRSFVTALDQATRRSTAPTEVLPATEIAASSRERSADEVVVPKRRMSALSLIAMALVIVAALYVVVLRDDKSDAATTPPDPSALPTERTDVATTNIPTAAYSSAEEVAWSINTTMPPSQGARYSIALAAGETIFLNIIQVSTTTDFVLQSPGGRSEVFNTYLTEGPFVIQQTGEHILSVVPRNGAEASIHAELVRLAEPVLLEGSIYSGDRFTAITDLPGQKIIRHMDLPADTNVYLHVMNSKTTTDFVLIAPNERTEIFNSYRDAGPVRTREAGVYTLHVDPRDAGLADVEAAMYVVSPVEIDQGESALDVMLTDRTTLPGQIVRRTFQLTAGEHVFLHVARNSVTTDFTLLTPDNNRKLLESYRSVGPIEVPVSGAYTLIADPRDAALADHDLRLVRVLPPVIDGGDIRATGVVNGSTQLPGQVVEYRLNLSPDTVINFAASNMGVIFDFRLLTSDRTRQLFETYDTAADVVVPAAGEYVLQADPRDEAVGAYTFKLELK